MLICSYISIIHIELSFPRSHGGQDILATLGERQSLDTFRGVGPTTSGTIMEEALNHAG